MRYLGGVYRRCYFFFACIIVISVWFYIYKRSVYYQETGNSYRKILYDKGLWGEYKIVQLLQSIKGYHKTLVNVYLPDGKGGTTEVDTIFIHETGIYVIESKNYSGWIFGKERDKKWCQTFPNGKKIFFNSPIDQNHYHISALQQVLYMVPPELFYSLIIFSERCSLKKIDLQSTGIFVVKRGQLPLLLKNLNKPSVLSHKQINNVYEFLKRFTIVTEEEKQQHINRMKHPNEKKVVELKQRRKGI